MMKTIWQDLRYAARMLWKTPGFTIVAVLSLTLGIGANTAIFSFVNAVLLRALPIAEPERLVFVFSSTRAEPYNVAPYPDYVDYRDRNKVFSGLTAYSGITVSLNNSEQVEQISGVIVAGNYFDVLGVSARAGRTFLPEEDQTPGAHPVVIISHGLWQKLFASDANAVGQQLLLNGQPFTIVGVAPAGFDGAEAGRTNDIYVPIMMQAVVRPPRSGYSGEMNPDLLRRRNSGWLNMIGRLKPDISFEQAQSEMKVLAKQLEDAYPDTNKEETATLFPVKKGDPDQRGTLLSVAGLMSAVVGLVLLIACANVANLLLARASARRKEISIRLALGASRWRLIRQLLTESVFLSLVGGAGGLLLAVWLVDVLQSYSPPGNFFPVAFDFSLDAKVLAFTLLLSVLTGIIFGIAPALQASNPDLVHALKDETVALPGRSSWGFRGFNLRNLLVVAQVALSLVLLISAGLFLRSLHRAQRTDPGFSPENVLSMPLNIHLLRYTKTQGQEFYRQVIERVEAIPGVRSATLSRTPPLSGASRQSTVLIEGREGPDRAGGSESTSGNPDTGQNLTLASPVALKYFETMNIPLWRGRDFTAQDREGAPGVIIINETFARRYFPDQDPLGKRLSLSGARGPWLEVIGLARDGKYITLGETSAPMVYQSILQRHETGMTLLIRTTGDDPSNFVAGVRREVQTVEKNLPVTNIRPMIELLNNSLFPARMGAVLLGVFGLLALLLAAVGLYGVMSYSVARRTREIGIRMALGARGDDVLGLVLREGMALVAVGVLLGLGVALAVTRLLASFLYGVSTTDPLTFAGIAVFLTLIALVASFIPAHRASRVDPMIALRYE